MMYNEEDLDLFTLEIKKLLNIVDVETIQDDDYCNIMKEMFLSTSTNNSKLVLFIFTFADMLVIWA